MLATPVAAEAQGKVWRIAFLGVANAAASSAHPGPPGRAPGARLRRGQKRRDRVRSAESRYDRLPALAAELVRLNPDVIITHGVPGTLALKQATSTIPIVMAAIGNPVEGGAMASLARPGGNITGSAFLSAEVTAKRLDS